MAKLTKRIEIVVSTDSRLNTMSRESQLSIQTALNQHYTAVTITMVTGLADLEQVVLRKPDIVMLGMKRMKLAPVDALGRYGSTLEFWPSNYLREHGIAFTGSDTRALMLEFAKHRAKQAVMDAGLRSSAYFVSTASNRTSIHSLQFPLFVKPVSCGGSKGVDEQSVVYSDVELGRKVRSMHIDHNVDAIVEEYLPGREFSVAVVAQPHSDELLALPIEIVTPPDQKGNSFLSKAVKKADSERVIAVVDPALRHRINTLAISAFRALGSRDYGRIDMRLDAQGVPHFMEANLMPGLSHHGYMARCFFMNRQIGYDDMLRSIVALGLKRSVQLPTQPVALRRRSGLLTSNVY